MPIMDANLLLCDEQDFGGCVANRTVTGENVIDLEQANLNPGRSAVYLNVLVTEGFDDSATSKLVLSLDHSADNTTWASLLITAALKGEDLATPGVYAWRVGLPHDCFRYLRLDGLVSGAAAAPNGFNTGELTAWLGLEMARGIDDAVVYGAISGA